MIKPTTLPGMMELLPKEQLIFEKMRLTIEKTFQKYAFLPLDTPVMEKLEILLAKGGGETSKQVYKIENSKKDIGLRFDLTVPLARYVAQYFSALDFPFRRYHIGKVYRGERNQKGRYREFYQCDVDIIGHDTLSVYNDAEIVRCMAEIFDQLNISYQFQYNNRKLLNGYFRAQNVVDTEMVLRSIDKLDKIGAAEVKKILMESLSEDVAENILQFIAFQGTNDEILSYLEHQSIEDALYLEGIAELRLVYDTILQLGVSEENIRINLSITRGLDYYTGSVFETLIPGHEEIGSICSGGRYDDLASNYTKQKLPGVGMSIGLTRLFYQLMESDLIALSYENQAQAVVIPMEGYESYALDLVRQFRLENVKVLSYLEKGKIKKKFMYADKIGAPYVIIIGENEVQEKKYAFRNMKTGEQSSLSFSEIQNILNTSVEQSK